MACGGTMTTASVLVEYNRPVMVAGALDSRTRMTVRAAKENANAVMLIPAQNVPMGEGFPLYPGESYTFDGDAARVAVWVVAPWAGDKRVYVITEGA